MPDPLAEHAMTTPYDCIRHRCDFCRRSYASVTKARRHEEECWRNPATRSCPTCIHFQPSPFIDCALGLGTYDASEHYPEDDPRFHWEQNCPSWAAITLEPTQ